MVNRKITESEMMKMLQSGYVLLNPLVIEKIEKVNLEDVNRLGKEIQDIHQYSFAVVSPNTFKL